MWEHSSSCDHEACLRVVVRGRSWKVGADRCAAVVPRPANGRAEPRVRALRERRHNVGEDETVGNLCQPSSDTMGCATWELIHNFPATSDVDSELWRHDPNRWLGGMLSTSREVVFRVSVSVSCVTCRACEAVGVKFTAPCRRCVQDPCLAALLLLLLLLRPFAGVPFFFFFFLFLFSFVFHFSYVFHISPFLNAFFESFFQNSHFFTYSAGCQAL